MIFSHKQQIEWLEEQKKNVSSVSERQMLSSMLASIYDSQSHRTISNNMVKVEMNHARYVRYMELVVNPDNLK